MNHFATPEFWFHYQKLPTEVKQLADKNFCNSLAVCSGLGW